MQITNRAIKRYRQRVAPDTDRRGAEADLERFLAGARFRPTPRAWMRGTRTPPGVRFAYCADQPGVAVVLRGNAALTVITREMCRGAKHERLQSQRTQRR